MAGEAGCRSRLVTIQQLIESNSGSGFPIESWTLLCTTWMEREDLGGSERFTAEQLSARADVRWTLPYQATMDPELVDVPKARRLLYQGRTYDIQRATPRGWHDLIELETLSKAGGA